VEELESALSEEIRRLCGSCPARRARDRRSALITRPIEWWRERLMGWVDADTTRRSYPVELLDGLAAALRDFDDEQLLVLIQSEASTVRQRAPCARP